MSHRPRPIAATRDPAGAAAARLRQRRRTQLETLRIPPDALPGSLTLTSTRCGKPTCHCAQEGAEHGHAGWQLTFMAGGRKRVERVPQEWVDEVRRRVEAGRAFREAIAEVFVINAELLVLERRERRAAARRAGAARRRGRG